MTLDTDLDVDGAARADRPLPGPLRLPHRPARAAAAARSSPSSTPGWATRAVAYRRIKRHPGRLGHGGQRAADGVRQHGRRPRAPASRSRATRSPARPSPSGDFLVDAQGEDVVSGVRTPRDLSELDATGCPSLRAQLARDPAHARAPLRRHAGHRVHGRGRPPLHAADAQRQAPRPGGGALRRRRRRGGPADAARRRSRRSTPARSTRCCTRPSTPTPATTVLARGVAASPGAAKGEIVFTAEDAVAAAADGRAVILVRPFTEADDVAGFHAAEGILTSEGGKASHAALVARGMGRPAVTGRGRPRHRPPRGRGADRRARPARRATLIAIDGSTGAVTLDDVPLVRPRVDARFAARARVVRRAAHARRARQRRHAGGRAPRARVRRRGHRAVPDGAHVHGRRPPAEDARDDHGRRRGRPAGGARRAAAAPAGRLRGPLRGDGRACRSRSGCSTRRCTSSCPIATSWSSG